MCVATIALAGTALAATGAVVGGIEQGQAAHYQAQVARNNAIIEQQNAGYTASAAASQTEQEGLKERGKLAAVRAAEAANGLDVNSGSPADVQESERLIGRLDTETVSNNAALQAYGFQTRATSDEAQARLDQREATGDVLAGVVKGAGIAASNPTFDQSVSSLISGAPSVPDAYSWMQIASPDDEASLGGGF